MDVKLQFTNPANEVYLRMLMKVKRNEPIKINGNIKAGKYLLSKLRYSNIPVKQSSGTELVLPKTHNEQWTKYFCYYSVLDQIQINYYLESTFDLALRIYFQSGKELLIPNKYLAERYINITKQSDSPTILDQLLKSNYRSRKNNADLLLFDIDSIDY